jgi:hypothetical protein
MLDLKSNLSLENVSGLNLVLGAALAWSVAWFTSRILRFRGLLKGINHLPGYRYAISPFSLLGRLIPFDIPYINRKADIHTRAKRVGELFSCER